ncbi:MAG: hypothetical protein MSA56_10140 [Clostridium sp.]|nr:hypothetical protein [Clostridium sp.]
MEFYNYTGRRNMVAEKSAAVVEKYRKMYQENIQMYNYTKAGKQKMINDLVVGMENELDSLKKNWAAEAREGVINNKNKLLEMRASTAPKSEQAKTNEMLSFFKEIQLMDAKISLYGPDIHLLQDMSTDESVSAELFEIFKAKMVAAEQDETNRANIRLMKKRDLKMEKIDNDILDFKTIESNINEFLLPVGMTDTSSYTLITGEDLSDTFFQSNDVIGE